MGRHVLCFSVCSGCPRGQQENHSPLTCFYPKPPKERFERSCFFTDLDSVSFCNPESRCFWTGLGSKMWVAFSFFLISFFLSLSFLSVLPLWKFPLRAHCTSDWPHFKCSLATCGWCLPYYWTAQIKTFPSLQKVLLASTALLLCVICSHLESMWVVKVVDKKPEKNPRTSS